MFIRIFAAIIAALLAGNPAAVAVSSFGASSTESRGYPAAVIEFMDEQGQAKLCSGSYTFVTARLAQYDGDRVTVTEIGRDDAIEISEDEGSLAALWVVSEKPGTGELLVQMTYNWHPLPLIRTTDTAGAFWNETEYRLVEDSFYKTDKYTGVLLDENGTVITVYENLVQEESTEPISAEDGVTWKCKLSGITGLVVTGLYGYAEFMIEPLNDFTGEIGFGYLHKTLGGIIKGKTVKPDFTISP